MTWDYDYFYHITYLDISIFFFIYFMEHMPNGRIFEFPERYFCFNTRALLIQLKSFDKLYIILPKGTGKKPENTVPNGKIPGQDAWFPARG